MQTKWERFCHFTMLFPGDGRIQTLPAALKDLVPVSTEAAVQHLRQLQTKEEIIDLLQARLSTDVLVKAMNNRAGFSTMTRPQMVENILRVHKGAPPRPGEAMNPQLFTLINFANGEFDENLFLAGSKSWRIKQGKSFFTFSFQNRTETSAVTGTRAADFSAITVWDAYERFPLVPVTVRNGLFQGRRFPNPQECKRIYDELTWNEGLLNEKAASLWIYENLGTSSFFNDLFQATEFFLNPASLNSQCPFCEVTPCMAFHRALDPFWISFMREPPAGVNAEGRRFRAYQQCHLQIGYARIPIHDCWLLAIRCTHPGGAIRGFRPKYLKVQQPQQVVVEIAVNVMDYENVAVVLPEAGEEEENPGEEQLEEDSEEEELEEEDSEEEQLHDPRH